MKKNFVLIIVILFAKLSFGQVQITEIHYDDNGADSNEGVEIAASITTSLSGWSIVLFDATGSSYSTTNLSGTLNLGIYQWSAIAPINNGDGGVVLYKDNGTTVVQALSYGTVTAPTGVTYTALPVAEDKFTAGGTSMQLTDTGWVTEVTATPNTGPVGGLTLSVKRDEIKGFKLFPTVVDNGRFSITTNNSQEKNVQIYSILGSLVYNKIVQPYENVNIRNLSTGLYFVQVEEDKRVSIKKIIVN